jgi:hypothetical protein
MTEYEVVRWREFSGPIGPIESQWMTNGKVHVQRWGLRLLADSFAKFFMAFVMLFRLKGCRYKCAICTATQFSDVVLKATKATCL